MNTMFGRFKIDFDRDSVAILRRQTPSNVMVDMKEKVNTLTIRRPGIFVEYTSGKAGEKQVRHIGFKTIRSQHARSGDATPTTSSSRRQGAALRVTLTCKCLRPFRTSSPFRPHISLAYARPATVAIHGACTLGSRLEERAEIMENAVYWQGRQVGIECAGQILWFSSAPKPAMEAYGPQARAELQTMTVDADIARNLLRVAS
jgi:hypothetical protein